MIECRGHVTDQQSHRQSPSASTYFPNETSAESSASLQRVRRCEQWRQARRLELLPSPCQDKAPAPNAGGTYRTHHNPPVVRWSLCLVGRVNTTTASRPAITTTSVRSTTTDAAHQPPPPRDRASARRPPPAAARATRLQQCLATNERTNDNDGQPAARRATTPKRTESPHPASDPSNEEGERGPVQQQQQQRQTASVA